MIDSFDMSNCPGEMIEIFVESENKITNFMFLYQSYALYLLDWLTDVIYQKFLAFGSEH